MRETRAPGHATELAHQAYVEGVRDFIAVGGDGTSYEILNGLFPQAAQGQRVTLGFLPLGTGNSFLRDFTHRGAEAAHAALVQGRRRPCDLLRLRGDAGVFYSLNLISLGFVADACAEANGRFKRYGAAGYLMGVAAALARLHPRELELRMEDGEALPQPITLVALSNSRYTGGRLMLAPVADTADALVDVVSVGAVGRGTLLRALPRVFAGTHLQLPPVTLRRSASVDFELPAPLDVMIDGEVTRMRPERLEVLPGALDVRI